MFLEDLYFSEGNGSGVRVELEKRGDERERLGGGK